jgi:DNA mismatch repair protein MutL
LINKIAAGEVVQRPASVVKELVENAIDAGASRIQLIVGGAGRDRVQVVDDGSGMSPGDAKLALTRHATSKISSIEDLQRIKTLGFRGEALASMAAVSHLTLKTKRMGDAAGTQIRVDGGIASEPEPVAMEPGTSVTVQNLFHNVPARRKFLKTNATELKHIVEVFHSMAISHPEIGFSLEHDDHELHRLEPAADSVPFEEALADRLGALFSKARKDLLVPVLESTSYLSITGFVAKPEFNRKSRGEQFLFINKRHIRDRRLEHAILQAYGEMLPKGAYPFATLFISLDPSHIDVNVHPTKAEIKFDDDRGVYGFILAVVRKALGSADLRPGEFFRTSRVGQSPTDGESTLASAGDGATMGLGKEDLGRAWADARYPWTPDPGQSQIFRGEGMEHHPPQTGAVQPGQSGTGADEDRGPTLIASRLADDVAPGGSLIWQLHEKYILARIRSGLMIVDQHAAHERILYEKALVSMEQGLGMTQQLLFPHTIELEPGDHEQLLELLPDLRSLGFDIERFGARAVIVRGVPADIRVGNERAILEEILDQYKAYRLEYRLGGRDNLAKSVACRTAIKTGQRLSQSEMQSLIDQLFNCKMPYACPHGRPTMVRVSLDELDRRFGRIGHLERE